MKFFINEQSWIPVLGVIYNIYMFIFEDIFENSCAKIRDTTEDGEYLVKI